MNWGLPASVEIGGEEYKIRSGYQDILNICVALEDPELCGTEKSEAALWIFYPDAGRIPAEYREEALERCFWFINGGESERHEKSPRLVDWEKDFPYICAPLNRVLGSEVRAAEHLHWWTFLAAYMEIGDCTFAQIVRIRDKLAHGKPLDKEDRAWYRQNRQLVDIQMKYTEAQQGLMKEWGGA